MTTTSINDFKGNVTSRPPLDGSSAYNYTWDAYDRLTDVARSGQNAVNYKYDAAGRLLKRTEAPTGVDTTTVNYWVGLNRVAEEEWAPDNATYAGRALAVFRPDEETAATPAAGGWMRWSNENGAMTYEADAERGKVLKLTDENGESIPYSSNYLIGDRPTVNFNDADAPFADASRRHLGMWLKAPASTGDAWGVTVLVRTAQRGEAQITFATENGTDNVSGDCFTVYLGSSYMQGGPWRYWEWDLAATVAALDAGDSLTYVDGIVFRVGSTSTSGLYVDDIVLSDGRLKRSYAMLPGAALGGVLGSWTGPNVVAEAGNRVRYFQYNDLGTVLAQTKSDGTLEGAWEPDHFGNYEGRYVYSGSPTRPELGLTGKFYDDTTGLYYFNARWYDSVRGRWMSEDPMRIWGGLNLYAFSDNAALNFVDIDGRSIIGIVIIANQIINCGIASATAYMYLNCVVYCVNSYDDIADNPNIPPQLRPPGSSGGSAAISACMCECAPLIDNLSKAAALCAMAVISRGLPGIIRPPH